ncbi:2',3'-cyclic-nucleotide 3'-phosphodiesterase-like [Mytilus trossulus]|uniref:2',3'-cyclic-nucleotide 3'-phosphodiesterase-like n=1 Tax=Mytilus trossulus TaxID=6551 RepID=UPI003004F20E
MIVLFHELYIIVQTVIKWLRPKQLLKQIKHGKHVKFDDELDGRKEEVVEEMVIKDVCGVELEGRPPDFSVDKNDKTVNFPFLCDEPTISHIKHSKTMFIMRGVSGSGKSTLVKLIGNIYRDSRICSADQYFMKNGEYRFDKSNLSIAHEKCDEKAKKACLNGVPVVVIDNTNVKRWEMSSYLALAFTNNYPVVVVQPRTPWSKDADKLAELNSHGVTSDIIRQKLRSFEDVAPLYYGWFIDEQQSNMIYQLGRKSLEECLRIFPQFKDLLLFKSPDLLEAVEKELDDCIMKCTEWYGLHFPELKKLVPNSLIYARVVKQLGHRKNANSKNFSNILPRKQENDVKFTAKHSMGKDISDEDLILITDLCVQIIELTDFKDNLEEFIRNPMTANSPKVTEHVGQVIGPLLISHADTVEQKMYENFKLNSTKILHCTAMFMGTKRNPAPNSDTYPNMDIVQRSYGSVHDLEITRITVTPRTIGAKVQLSKQCLKLYEKPQEKEREINLRTIMNHNSVSLEFGRAAHVTIGTVPGIPPATTNEDLLDILDAEMKSKLENIPITVRKCALGTIQNVGKDLFIVNLESPITVQGLYTGFYGGSFNNSPKK